MMDLDRWREIYATLNQHKLRTCLTAFGVFWGMFMLVIVLGVSTGFERGTIRNFGGSINTIYMWVGGRSQIPYKGLSVGRRPSLNDRDQAGIANLEELQLLTSVNELGGWQAAQYITRGHRYGSFIIRGVEPDAFPLSGIYAPQGRVLNDLDLKYRRKVAIIGIKVKKILFSETEDPIGEYIALDGISFRIVGVSAKHVTGEQSQGDDERILIPNSTLRHTYNQMGWIGHFRFAPKPGVDAKVLEEKARKLLMNNHHIHPDDKGVIASYNTQVKYNKTKSMFSGIRIFCWAVAIGTIIAGAVGVGNIMLIVVKERTREIGVRKALGATATDIIVTIIQETLVLTLLAGYIGLVVGVGTLEFMNHYIENAQGKFIFDNPSIEFTTAIIALVTLIVAGLLASVLPAAKAAHVNPIIALQDE